MRTRHLVAAVAWDEEDHEAIVECVGDTLDEQIDFLDRVLKKLQEQRDDRRKLEAIYEPSLTRDEPHDLDDFDEDEGQDDEPWGENDAS